MRMAFGVLIIIDLLAESASKGCAVGVQRSQSLQIALQHDGGTYAG